MNENKRVEMEDPEDEESFNTGDPTHSGPFKSAEDAYLYAEVFAANYHF
jgi:hypothetical protein